VGHDVDKIGMRKVTGYKELSHHLAGNPTRHGMEHSCFKDSWYQ